MHIKFNNEVNNSRTVEHFALLLGGVLVLEHVHLAVQSEHGVLERVECAGARLEKHEANGEATQQIVEGAAVANALEN
jgi:hypothetical protein